MLVSPTRTTLAKDASWRDSDEVQCRGGAKRKPETETGPKDLKKEDHSERSRNDQSEARFFAQLVGAVDRRFAKLDRELSCAPIDGRTTASTSNTRSTRGFRRTSPSRARGAFGRVHLSGVPDYPNGFVIA